MPDFVAGAPGSIHIVLQNKGGVGKSFVASHVAQFFAAQGLPIAVFDSDPATPTLAGYSALQVEYVDLMDEEEELDVTKFDLLTEKIMASSDKVVVVDTGSSNFLALMAYVKGSGVLQIFAQLGRPVVIHSVLVGGAGGRETLAGLVSVVTHLPAYGFVAWKNPFFGPVVFDGKLFEETKAYLTAKDKLIGVVSPKHRTGGNRVLHTNAVQQMAKQRLTYEEALASPAFSLLDRQRLRETQREINDQLLGIFGHVQPIPTASARQIGRL